MYSPNGRSELKIILVNCKKRAKEITRMWLKVIKRIKIRIEKLRDMENAMQRSTIHLIECPDGAIGRTGEQQH